MTLTVSTPTELASLFVLGLGLSTYRIVVEDGTGYRCHTTTVRCTKREAEDLALRFLTIWRDHAVTTEQLD